MERVGGYRRLAFKIKPHDPQEKQVEKLLDLDRFDRLECIKAFRDIKIGDSFRVVQPALCDWDAALCSGEVYMAFHVHAGNVDNFLIHKSKKKVKQNGNNRRN